ncbi:MAG: DUF1614 domain-containing protein [Candidatus Bathyarchaeota archaeon]|nr:DUF1614 domain-containing protein [Candidatus Bathyarchaeota archaeon]
MPTRRLRDIFYRPVHNRTFMILSAILSIVFYLFYVNIIGTAFQRLFPSMGRIGIFLILVTCLLGSFVNIPLKKYSTTRPKLTIREVSAFGITYPVPDIRMGRFETLLALNVGGALVPTVTSLYLLTKIPPDMYLNLGIALIVVTAIVRLVSRPIQGMGIIVPILIPPAISSLVALVFGGDFSHIIAYVSGTLGTLLGADILNLNRILNLGAPIISIGGAGTFDGVFLAGVFGVLLA